MATFIQLVNYNSSEEKEREFFNQENKFVVNEQADFTKIPGSPIAYWVSENIKHAFQKEKIEDKAILFQGIITGNNEKFVRYWQELSIDKISLNAKNIENLDYEKSFWVPYNKGGASRKWYGNQENVVNFRNKGKDFTRGKHQFYDFFFKPCFSWTYISSSSLATRYFPNGFIWDVAGSSVFPDHDEDIFYFLALIASKTGRSLLDIINPTMNFQVENIAIVPVIYPDNAVKFNTVNITHQCIDISREEWNSRETSWDFTTNELLHHKTTNRIEDAYNNYCSYWKDQFFKLHTNEEELNSIFIDIYDLADELTPDVPLEDITILKDESEIKDGKLVFKKETIIKQFISYAVGCMFGRYSPDREGLILANQGETIDDFREKVPDPSFMPDDDNIIPILEDEYFTDDIVSRFKEFLKATFGAESLAENLDFIAGALSKSKNGSKSPEKTIRDYFLKSFFKDHTRTYKKRPIYWLFTSGKGRGFNALVYMHRYDKTTLAKMRTDYLLELESKLDARMDMLSSDSAREKQEREKLSAQIEELAAYDEVLNNKALVYIDIDLDDGVVVNYAKFEGLVGKV